ncbi:hypothetical protein GDO81_000330 [Engystomops pustulosus]|uniref:Secreted protein n=1 Tax=Engystomops pustulosus TaxID=76066 RepID=A0AAV7D6I4_ENGPU|nr:hypothetical protein GDO81_000330 [Engystomops pustulosus]
MLWSSGFVWAFAVPYEFFKFCDIYQLIYWKLLQGPCSRKLISRPQNSCKPSHFVFQVVTICIALYEYNHFLHASLCSVAVLEEYLTNELRMSL